MEKKIIITARVLEDGNKSGVSLGVQLENCGALEAIALLEYAKNSVMSTAQKDIVGGVKGHLMNEKD